MAVTSLSTSYTAYQRTSQMQSARTSSSTARQDSQHGVAASSSQGAGRGDSLTISDPVAFANRVLHDKVIDQLNAYMAETPDLQPIGSADPSQVTPEGTAKFIVDMATGFYSAYAENHKGEGDQEKLDGFMSLIKQGVEKGFNEARGILDALKVLNFGTVSQDIDTTYDLVQKGLDDFYQKQKEAIGKSATAPTANSQETVKAAEAFGSSS